MTLVENWRVWWKKWSTWLAAFNAALWTFITGHSGMLLGFMPFVRPAYRDYALGAVFAITFILPVLIAQIRQPKLSPPCPDGEEKKP